MSSKSRQYLRDAASELQAGRELAHSVLEQLPVQTRQAFLKVAKCTSAAECAQQAPVGVLQQVMQTIAHTESKLAARSEEAAEHLSNGHEHVHDAFFERQALAIEFVNQFCASPASPEEQAVEEVASDCAWRVPVDLLLQWAKSKSG